MTSNNLEAIELLKTCVERLQDQGFSSDGNTVSELNKAIDLLQADEVKEELCLLCKMPFANFDKHVRSDGSKVHKFECPTPPKPTKETKLRELKKSILYGATEPGGGLMELISILLEEEY